jgi:predicted NBD/HSP70 family sugar kinase
VDVTATLRQALARHRVRYLANSVTIDNEADLAAVAHHRARGGPSSFVYVSAGVGVGGGVIVDGAVFRGAHGFAGELGHFVVRPGGQRCRCGNRGCLETEIGLAAVMRRTRTCSTEQLLDRLTGPRGTAELRRLSTNLATAIGPVLNLFDPESVVLGGYLAPLTDLLRDELQSRLAQLVLGSRWAGYTIEASAAGPDAASIGAALCALRPVLDDPRRLAELARQR